jgi:hypothetical protein
MARLSLCFQLVMDTEIPVKAEVAGLHKRCRAHIFGLRVFQSLTLAREL